MHSGGLELAKLICTRLEDNLIRHRGDWFWDYDGVISESWTGVCFRAGVDIGVGIGIRVGAGGGVRIGIGLGLRLRFGADHGLPMDLLRWAMNRPWVYDVGPWVTHRLVAFAHGSPMGPPWAAHGSLMGL